RTALPDQTEHLATMQVEAHPVDRFDDPLRTPEHTAAERKVGTEVTHRQQRILGDGVPIARFTHRFLAVSSLRRIADHTPAARGAPAGTATPSGTAAPATGYSRHAASGSSATAVNTGSISRQWSSTYGHRSPNRHPVGGSTRFGGYPAFECSSVLRNE